ncbi:glutathione S-transferase [Pseudooceanicola sp. 216_PA32_1]|uniref:Glutathione S-transferase n=1 Tax=Pseudooceanicola pacificus TaxID=2676438 RepID=A0A844W800_9RHOB|nr:glutathione S-transferase family protein [Pseudooceanicola pacificus]MWB76568.1 glutathione S-transferase [Pseudooceanicola pacificus]
MYDLYGSATSRAFRVIWFMEEAGIAYNYHKFGPHAPEVRALSPLGKVPVLVADGTPISDSAAIVTFLADRHGQLTAPAGSVERAQQDAVLHQVLDEMDAILWVALKHTLLLPEDMRVPAIKPALKAEYARNEKNLAKRLKGEFLMGDKMSVPDIFATHCLNWAQSAKFANGIPELDAYLARMTARPAYLRAMELRQAAA